MWKIPDGKYPVIFYNLLIMIRTFLVLHHLSWILISKRSTSLFRELIFFTYMESISMQFKKIFRGRETLTWHELLWLKLVLKNRNEKVLRQKISSLVRLFIYLSKNCHLKGISQSTHSHFTVISNSSCSYLIVISKSFILRRPVINKSDQNIIIPI